jgi:hypothetical protein
MAQWASDSGDGRILTRAMCFEFMLFLNTRIAARVLIFIKITDAKILLIKNALMKAELFVAQTAKGRNVA